MVLENTELDKDLLKGVSTEEDLEKIFLKETGETEEKVEENQDEHNSDKGQEGWDDQHKTQDAATGNKDEQLLTDDNHDENYSSETSMSFSLGFEGSIHSLILYS